MKKDWSIGWSILVVCALVSLATCAIVFRDKLSPPPIKEQPKVSQPVCAVNADKLLAYVNQERAKLGKQQLTVDTELVSTANERVQQMVTGKYFGHHQADGSEWYTILRQKGIEAAVSEDLNSSDNTPEQSWAEFKASPDHYLSLTDGQYSRVGIVSTCVDYTVKDVSDSNDVGLIGEHITDLTVVHLASEEPKPSYETPSPGALCNDGTTSPSVGRGTCSHHQGVDHYY